ncbi:MAG: hypothetical protein QOI99_1829 [Actinomycetota bacterium]|jgi:hypothetical protein|nr:hypothetical protein [Actinomycetota bacterium]
MAIGDESEAPAESVEAVLDAVRVLAGEGRFRSDGHAHLMATDVQLSRPQQVFTLGLDELQEGATLQQARPIAWRYLVEGAERPLALAETVIAEDGSHRFGQMSYGGFLPGTVEAIETAENLAPDARRLRMLHVPALYFLGVWVARGDEEMIIPVAPTFGFEPNRPYPAAEVLRNLTERAQALPSIGPEDEIGT